MSALRHRLPQRAGLSWTALEAARVNPLLLGSGIAMLCLVLLFHGLYPGYVNDQAIAYLTEGAIRCEHALGLGALIHSCHAYGNPLGYPLLTNGPVIALGALAMYLPGVGPGGAFLIAEGLIDAAALAGGYALMRRLGTGKAVALWAAGLYLLTPTVIGMRFFPGTFSGFVLLPCYALADLVLFAQIDRVRSRRLVGVVILYCTVRAFALFLDGYSFIASAMISAALWCAWAWPRRHRLRVIASAAAVLAGANVIAYALYKWYVPGPFGANPIELFRAMGLDLVTLVAPSDQFWLAHYLGIGFDTRRLWGDGTNANYNYIGFICIALAIVGTRTRYAIALASVGLVALVLSFGPSLKVDNRAPMQPARLTTLQPYLMPAHAATATLPWGRLLARVPGVKVMRATYRWFGVTRLALVLLAGLGIDALARRRKLAWRAVAVVGAAAVTLELVPNLPNLLGVYRANAKQMNALTTAVGPELRSVTHPGELVFFLNYDGSHNDFLANFLAPLAQIHSYNAGGDKDIAFVERTWPATIKPLATRHPTADEVFRALSTGAAHVVIAPYFHVRWAAYAWPPQPSEQAAAHRAFAALEADPRFHVERREWLAAISLAPRALR